MDIPRGIEVLVKKASVDPAFRLLLLDRRSAAADEIGLVLTPAEAMMIDSVPRRQLERIIAATRVEPGKLPAFLGKAAGVMLVALGAASVPTQSQVYKGVRADSPATAPADPPQPPMAGAVVAPVRAPAPPTTQPTTQATQPTSRPTTAPALSTADAQQVRTLVRQLDDNDYKVRQSAEEQLAKLMPAASDALKGLLRSGNLSAEQQIRIERVLGGSQPNPVPVIEIGIRVAGIMVDPNQ